MVEAGLGTDRLTAIVGGYLQPLEILFYLGFDGIIANIICKNIKEVPDFNLPMIFQTTRSQSFSYFSTELGILFKIGVGAIQDDIAGAARCN